MRRQWTCRLCLRLLGVALYLALLSGCSREISDHQLADLFDRNGMLFKHVVDRGLGSDLSCYESNDRAVCSISELTKTFDELRHSAGVKAIYARHDIPELGNAVYFVIAQYGFVTMSSYAKGLIYSEQSVQPLVRDTDDKPESPYRFNRIYGNWYAFVMP